MVRTVELSVARKVANYYSSEELMDVLAEHLVFKTTEDHPVGLQMEYDDYGNLSDLTNQLLVLLRQKTQENRRIVVLLIAGAILIRRVPLDEES